MRRYEDENLPHGAVKCHLYQYENVLRPRGGVLQKESLSETILARLEGAFESWTDKSCGDNPAVTELLSHLQANLKEETEYAWREFLKRINTK